MYQQCISKICAGYLVLKELCMYVAVSNQKKTSSEVIISFYCLSIWQYGVVIPSLVVYSSKVRLLTTLTKLGDV